MPTEVSNAFEVAFFFMDLAQDKNEYLQPQKLHGLMFLAQSYYAVATSGRKLMPAVFVTDERGPIEPNIYIACSKGRPNIDADLFISRELEEFLNAIWRRFGSYPTDKITSIIKNTSAFKAAKKRGSRAEIYLSDMELSFNQNQNIPNVENLTKSKVYRTQSGRSVKIKAWSPGSKTTN